MRYASRVVAGDLRVPSLVTHRWTSLWVIDPIALPPNSGRTWVRRIDLSRARVDASSGCAARTSTA